METASAKAGGALVSVVGGFQATVTAARLSRENKRVQALLDAAGESREQRRELMITLRDQGWTLQKIGDVLGLSPQSVRQMIQYKPKTRKDEQ